MESSASESDVEQENLYPENEEARIVKPFNPKDVDIVAQTMVIANIMDQLEYGDIILDPDFPRRPGLWNDVKQSRLIESLIIRIPLPTFYFDTSNDDKLIVVDGLQRLNAINRFTVLKKEDPQKLKLTGLEYLSEYEGYIFEELPMDIQRRIKRQEIAAYVIRSGTPDRVRNSIFERINTGGMVLTPAEIKNSVYRGQAADFLKKLAGSEEFKWATGNKIKALRMEDCEFVNRFLAFYILGLEEYQGNLEDYLNEVLIRIQKETAEKLNEYQKDFLKAMKYAYAIFEENTFRKINKNGKYGGINKPLYDAVSVNLARLSNYESDVLLAKKERVIEKYETLLKDADFGNIISNGTAKIENVKKRHETIYHLFRSVIEND